jgi:hypothetical protein
VPGATGFDGLERISTQAVMDILEVPQRQRTAGNYRHLAALMAELGWAPIRVRDFNGRGYKRAVALAKLAFGPSVYLRCPSAAAGSRLQRIFSTTFAVPSYRKIGLRFRG